MSFCILSNIKLISVVRIDEKVLHEQFYKSWKKCSIWIQFLFLYTQYLSDSHERQYLVPFSQNTKNVKTKKYSKGHFCV